MRLAVIAVAAAALVGPLAHARPIDTEAAERHRSNCYDDNMVDRCDPAVRRDVRARFGLASVEQLSEADTQMRRAFFVDGHGNELPVVTFERAHGQSPQVRVSAIVADSERSRVVNMVAPASLDVWNDAIERSQYFHRALADEQPTPSEALPPGYGRAPGMCLHSWVVTVEASDPGADLPVRSKTQDACNDGLVIPFAFHLADLAYRALPACSGIRVGDGREPITALALCALLDGDMPAAGEALNQAMLLSSASRAALLIHDMAEIEWSGRTGVRGFDALREWPRLMEGNLLQFHRVSGIDADHASISGEVVQYERVTNAYPRRRSASFEQTWVRENGFDFRLRTMRVSAWSDWKR
jgi:hypothetical protein